MTAVPNLSSTWHPIATEYDVPVRHVFHGQLLGRELAVWRADDGFVNVWENRCLHRGVRLSIGINEGRELRCQYHGWRYSNRSAGCTYIPAHPADAPARTICNRTFPAVERYGLVWSGEDPQGEPPRVPALEDGDPVALRSVAVNAPMAMVLQVMSGYRFSPTTDAVEDATITVDRLDDRSVLVGSRSGSRQSWAVFFAQPVDTGRTVVRGVLAERPAEGDLLAVFRHHNNELLRVRDEIEVLAVELPPLEPLTPTIEQVPVELAGLPEPATGRAAPLRVRVVRKWEAARGVAGFELESIGEPLPTHQPGAHIDVHLPNGLIRQYSLTNPAGDGTTYRIGVKLEPESRGGSECLHETVREGDVLAISEPRNNFPLRRDAVKTLLVAGGIGITPLLAMAQTLDHDGLAYELHCYAQSDEHLAFPEVVGALEGTVVHLGLSPEETSASLEDLLAGYHDAMHVYLCGPGPMLEVGRAIAAAAGWPDDAIHFEYFKNATELDDSTEFDISLARSALTLRVSAGDSILDVLRANGVPVPSSCEQGACGTCQVRVLDGEPLHQDVYLNDSERAAGDRIMTCVSRSRSDRLVLDV